MKLPSKSKILLIISLTSVIIFFLYFLGYPKEKIPTYIADKKTNSSSIPKPQGKSNLVFSILKTGEAKTLEGFVKEGGSVFKTVTVAHSAFYIQHPKGNFLFDTGLGSKVKEQFQIFPLYLKLLMDYKPFQTAYEQLESNGITPKSIQDVYFSHLHWDHASGLKDFPWAKIHSLPEELNDPKIELGYIPSQFDGDSVHWSHLKFSNTPYASYAKSLDLYGDGTVVFVPMKGHSEGSVGLFLHTDNGEVFFLTGDIVWRREGFLEKKHKPRGARWIVDFDTESLGEEIARVHDLIQNNPTLQIIPAHDNDVQSALGFFPKVIGR
ncbi:MBL fold metallo-hydrolase [Leptospira bandrabouensis]|uniref:MBL fold metallo-hydrolase n=1 Tax=Leptospira bandrabouensis TaxID=2484903 RepID=A0A6H3NS00_9LEPT|nr:MBL fold metallo-hydrolase [Leptospira bandrabouensis]MCG6150941.1 MBL fold metallo-hydrolase [Leptospira bandrabouensis]TGN05244.1 MBL fold metallo-hydrolase [Leptospira bandrabouensis]TGN15577.1 MBL fold metallo-hydrolase [Leptospira bandrabouensis]